MSDAVRAVSTLEHMALANPGLQKVDTHVCPELYQSSGSGLELVEALRRLFRDMMWDFRERVLGDNFLFLIFSSKKVLLDFYILCSR